MRPAGGNGKEGRMGALLAFSSDQRRRPRPPRRGEPRGEIVIFSGIRIERIPDPQPSPKAAPAKTRPKAIKTRP